MDNKQGSITPVQKSQGALGGLLGLFGLAQGEKTAAPVGGSDSLPGTSSLDPTGAGGGASAKINPMIDTNGSGGPDQSNGAESGGNSDSASDDSSSPVSRRLADSNFKQTIADGYNAANDPNVNIPYDLREPVFKALALAHHNVIQPQILNQGQGQVSSGSMQQGNVGAVAGAAKLLLA